MQHAYENERIIAIDLRSRSFGFVIFEGPKRILDWGIKNFRRGVNAVRIPADAKFGDLLDQSLPNAVVLMKRDIETKGRAAMREALQREAETRGISVQLVSSHEMKSTFVGSSRNKYTVAAVLIERFPELASRHPGPRKIWIPEHYVIKIFGAAALGIAYFSRHPNNSQQSSILSREA